MPSQKEKLVLLVTKPRGGHTASDVPSGFRTRVGHRLRAVTSVAESTSSFEASAEQYIAS